MKILWNLQDCGLRMATEKILNHMRYHYHFDG